MNTSKYINKSLAFLFLVTAIGFGAAGTAQAAKCYGCYDDSNGVEHCKTVEVKGACNVITFCKAAGCPKSDSARPNKLLSAAPVKQPLVLQQKNLVRE